LSLNSVTVAAMLLVLYLLCVGRQLLRGTARQDGRALDQVGREGGARKQEGAGREKLEEAGAPVSLHETEDEGAPVAEREPATPEGDEGVPAEIAAYCQALAADYGLTPREAEILALVALGRSAKYISEELMVSYNTTRTHVRHIYEKLNIHSKQELIDLVLFGSGVM
ncbi:LuxR family transcriptional regulator, partial [Enterorhabdus sp. NM05_H27]